MVLQHLDLSNNKLQGTLPVTWTDQQYGPLAKTLQALLLNSNQLSGPLPGLTMMYVLSCWSVAGNWFVCGNAPGSFACGAINGTKIGEGVCLSFKLKERQGNDIDARLMHACRDAVCHAQHQEITRNHNGPACAIQPIQPLQLKLRPTQCALIHVAVLQGMTVPA